MGLDENGNPLVYIYPNPNTGMFSIDLGTSVESVVEIFDAQGKLVYTSQLVNQKTDLNLNFATGVYNLRITNEKGISNKKLMIQK